MLSTGTRSSNELQWLDLKIGHQDSSSSNGHQGYMPHIVNKICITPASSLSMIRNNQFLIQNSATKYINSLKHSDAYMHQWNVCILIQISLNIVPEGLVINKALLVKLEA